jgi:hypothetical protein
VSAAVINLADARRAKAKAQDEANKPEWGDDIPTLAAYARLVKAEHQAESRRIDFEQLRDGITEPWWAGPDDIRERVEENNRLWARYIGLLQHLASLPAATRAEARVKRATIGKQWLADEPSCPGLFGPMREGCLRDDHLFPPSLRLARPAK